MTQLAPHAGPDVAGRPSRTPGPAAQTRPVLASWTLWRIGGLAATIADIVSSSTEAALNEISELDADVDRTGTELAEACYRLVPDLDDDGALRRRVLSVKRAAHSGRPLGVGPDVLARIARRPSGPPPSLLGRYQDLLERRERVSARLAGLVEADRDAAVESFCAALRGPELAAGLALAAPHWWQHGVPQLLAGRRDGRNLRTLYSYVTRAALKPSPFSTLATVGTPGPARSRRARSYASTYVAHAALHRAARDPAAAHALSYRPALRCPPGPGRPNGSTLAGFVNQSVAMWRTDEAGHAAGPAPLPGDSVRSLATVLHELGGAQPWLRYLRHLDGGLIEPVPPWGAGDDPLTAVADALVAAGLSGDLVQQIAGAARAATTLTSAPAADRPGRLRAIRERVDDWEAVTGCRTQDSEIVYEDVSATIALPDPLLPRVRAELLAVAATLRRRVFRSHTYDVLLQGFVDRYGTGGRCDDVLEFLVAAASDDQMDAAIARAGGLDMRAEVVTSGAAAGISASPVSMSLFVQLAAEDWQAVQDGRFLLAVNLVNPGAGSVLGRFGHLLGGTLTAPLQAWCGEFWPDDVARREVVFAADCNTGSRETSGVLPALGWPGEHGDGARPGLVHDADRDVLEFRADAGRGRLVGIAHRSMVPSALMSGVQRMMGVLADPWVLPYEAASRPWRLPGPDELVELPRVQHGRVVLGRRGWNLPVAALPARGTGRDASDLVLRVDRWRRDLGLPSEVFVRTDVAGGQPVRRKPLWVDLRSAWSLEVLYQSIESGTDRLRVEEALPAHRAQPLRDGEGAPRAAEFIATLRWPRVD